MEELRRALRTMGFTEQEISIYIKLLYLKESTASNLGKEMKIHRRGVYDTAERLVKRGILTFIEKDGKKYFRPIEPQQIVDILSERERVLKEERNLLSGLLPKIGSLGESGKASAEIIFGRDGIKSLYMNELHEGEPIHIICTAIDRTEELLGNFLVSYSRDRVKKGIPIKAIVARGAKTNLGKYGLMEVRYLPEDQVSPSSISIYGNRLAITLWSDEPITILIKSREIAESFRKHFEIIWKNAKK